MPPLSHNPQTSNFAASSILGPSTVHIRAMDVASFSDTGEVIVATGGGQDRSDRRISIWNAKGGGGLIKQLDNASGKPITVLTFHPTDPKLLLSADMDFSVKLWDWRDSGTPIRIWRKMHSRIIYKAVFIGGGGDFSRIGTCSADHTLKMWDIQAGDSSPPRTSSVHANEPFTSFVVCGEKSNDTSSQTLITSLSYCLRVYKMRTLALLHVIHLSGLKKEYVWILY
jgi:WD40 repeat protein